jgi:hypothetical protein
MHNLKSIWNRILVALIILCVLFLLGCAGEPVTETIEPEKEVEPTEAVESYEGSFKLAGEAVMGVDGLKIVIDSNVSECVACGNYTDIVLEENLEDFEGNVFTPGIYEFQFVEFPEEQGFGAWYVYINDDIKISGNPIASDSGKTYELKVGDIVSIEFWTIATFYKVSE